MTPLSPDQAITGALLGVALGDASGLAWEGLSRDVVARLGGGRGGPRLLFSRGLLSDDGEHACMTAQALLAAGPDPARFARSLAFRLRFWLLGLPGGMGLATGRAILKLWIGFPPAKSGVCSAGNGPAMRAPVLGAALCRDPERLVRLVSVSTRITHTDPRADYAAQSVACAAACAARGELPTPDAFARRLAATLGDGPGAAAFLAFLQPVWTSAARDEPARTLAVALGLERGVGGYALHTVAVVLQIWLRRPRAFVAAIEEIIALGGDTDTTAAILGGIIGAGVGAEGLPGDWLGRIVDWPRSVAWMRRLGARLAASLAAGKPGRALFLPFFLLPVRNLLFLALVLGHGFLRVPLLLWFWMRKGPP